MASITVEGGPSNWRALFEGHPGLAVTPENHDRLLAELAAPAPVPEAEEEPRPVPRIPPRRVPPAPAAEERED